MAEIKTDFTAIAVSGESCTGKSTLSRTLAAKLSWTHFDIGAEFRRLSHLYQLEIEHFGSIPEIPLRLIDEQISKRILTETKTIWDGRLACYLSKDFANVLRIYCTAPIGIRHERLSTREKISLSDAKTRIENRDIEERDVFQRLYSLSNPYNPDWIHLKIESIESVELLTERILRILN